MCCTQGGIAIPTSTVSLLRDFITGATSNISCKTIPTSLRNVTETQLPYPLKIQLSYVSSRPCAKRHHEGLSGLASRPRINDYFRIHVDVNAETSRTVVSPQVSSHDGSSHASGRRWTGSTAVCCVVPAKLVKPPFPRAAWTSPPTRV